MTDNPNIKLREARQEDYDKVIQVESLSTPNLSYVPNVWDMFLNDEEGDWSVAEIDGEVIGCGKYSLLPDASAWLETLRVVPHRQGLGVGKSFYEYWLDFSREKDVDVMRMYTGVRNVVSRGLAEKYGLRFADRFRGALVRVSPEKANVDYSFRQVSDSKKATELLMRHSEAWGGWLVMNRTFYKLSPETCTYLTENGMVYEDKESESVIALGARFTQKQGLHIGLFAGDTHACLSFAMNEAVKQGKQKLHCLFPSNRQGIEDRLTGSGFQLESSEFLVMEIRLD